MDWGGIACGTCCRCRAEQCPSFLMGNSGENKCAVYLDFCLGHKSSC